MEKREKPQLLILNGWQTHLRLNSIFEIQNEKLKAFEDKQKS